MAPILASFGQVSLYALGVAMLGALLILVFTVWKQGRVRGLSDEKLLDVFFLAAFFGFVGGRIGYVWENWGFFGQDLSRTLFWIKYPGFSLWGALGAMGGAVAIFSWAFGLPVGIVLDVFSLGVAAALGAVMVGCVFDGCSLGLDPLRSVLLFGGVVVAARVLFWVAKGVRELGVSRAGPVGGFVFWVYLIFVSLSFLIWGLRAGGDVLVWGLGLAAGVLVLAVRYRKVIAMIKFPSSVLGQISSYLEEQRKKLEKRMVELKREDPFSDKTRVLEASDDAEASDKAKHERVSVLSQQMNLVLIQTKKALAKIRLGRYGTCERCGKMIDTDRLAAIPTATLCVSCEKKKESGKK